MVSDWLPIVTWKSPSLIQKFDQVQVEQAALKQIARQKIEQNIQELQLEDSETFWSYNNLLETGKVQRLASQNR